MNVIDHITLDGTTKYIKDAAGQAMIAPEELSTTAANAYAVGEVFRLDGKLYKATAAIAVGDTFATEGNGANCEESNITNIYIKKTDWATTSAGGLVIVNDDGTYGVRFMPNGHVLGIKGANATEVKNGTTGNKPITPMIQNESVFYGLAKAAGDTTQSISTNAVGTYTSEASAAIRSMLGAVGDVQINSSSIVSNGIANIPFASGNTPGVIMTGTSYGISVYQQNGNTYIAKADSSEIKAGTNLYKPIVSYNEHEAAFYGLAKAAGDSTQSASSNTVGTYTSEAKAAIQSMLGIDLSSIAQQVEIPLVETVSGTTQSITGQPNTRYVCGEVSTISITPPASGSVDVIFESGSTATVLTVPNTVKWPAWFDATSLEANTTYEILITDATYGSVMTWAT